MNDMKEEKRGVQHNLLAARASSSSKNLLASLLTLKGPYFLREQCHRTLGLSALLFQATARSHRRQ
jgi:hypothetical protein